MRKRCKFIKEDKTRCRGVMLLEDGMCLHHSPLAEEVKEKVGREKAEIAKKFKLPNQSPMKQIRKFCVECSETWKDAQYCFTVDCPLWFLRFGKLPKAFVREKGVKHARLFDRKNFGDGKRYDSDAEMEEMSL